jgi:hypothetical protein
MDVRWGNYVGGRTVFIGHTKNFQQIQKYFDLSLLRINPQLFPRRNSELKFICHQCTYSNIGIHVPAGANVNKTTAVDRMVLREF